MGKATYELENCTGVMYAKNKAIAEPRFVSFTVIRLVNNEFENKSLDRRSRSFESNVHFLRKHTQFARQTYDHEYTQENELIQKTHTRVVIIVHKRDFETCLFYALIPMLIVV